MNKLVTQDGLDAYDKELKAWLPFVGNSNSNSHLRNNKSNLIFGTNINSSVSGENNLLIGHSLAITDTGGS